MTAIVKIIELLPSKHNTETVSVSEQLITAYTGMWLSELAHVELTNVGSKESTIDSFIHSITTSSQKH